MRLLSLVLRILLLVTQLLVLLELERMLRLV